ncbi:MAG: CRISPR-associated endonuclease Cas2 [Candidatus Chisholmbacteria bacterium RIFCSPHIGHO2_01_FULL_49_18]|uniref:CRISPR-associated endoribonuclease Cas2 n=1 Tax=Candidatus Chisholmbacteria bacterium RIFCSPHIGHO2_01_FULL_49_18 TaxID=1797590 RepID=A0A1G1VN02_9BACT|nr:MAG: CRISPR-associated endonuclease Cas2 [Candidatus Chisholmbacteria bacterium RIFCSPHIGHO2_01_FULL_49_18]
MRRRELRETIEDFSFGVLSTSINLVLSWVVFSADVMTAGRSPASVMRAVEASAGFRGVSQDSLKQAFWRAQNKGLLRRKRERGQEFWEATEEGRRRLVSELPVYLKHRPWNKRLYLVLYDIPEEQKRGRERLREKLVKIGAGRLQNSSYLILWDPTEVLRTFIREQGLSGMVIVSDTGTNGSIGEKGLDELVHEVYQLDELNRRYQEFMKMTKSKETTGEQLAFIYLSILKDDPQLPFELLGPTWMGDRAFETFETVLGSQADLFLSNKRSPVGEKVR